MPYFQVISPLPPIVFTWVLLAGYGFSIWWFLRKESLRTLLILSAITAVAAALRFYDIHDLPPGLNDDEVKTLKGAREFLDNRAIFNLGVEGPYLNTILFQVPLARIIDSTFWSMRLYPLVLGTLAVPMSFAVGRSMLFLVLPSFALSTLVATLPWSIFWSRISWGGEIIFYQTLLLAALGRIIWCRGGPVEMLIGTIGLIGLLWDYTGAWAMLGMPFVALLLAQGVRQRSLCLGVALLSLMCWTPWLLQIHDWGQHVSTKVTRSYSTDGYLALVYSFIFGPVRSALRTFLYPEGNVYWISMHSVSIHPLIVLGTAGLGLLTGLVRRSAFIALGFCGALVPSLVSFQGAASTHRMIGCFIFISIGCVVFLDFLERHLRRPSLSRALTVGFIALSSIQATSLFFSPQFWEKSDTIFSHSETLLSESIRLPRKDPTVVDGEIFRFLDARTIPNAGLTTLTYDSLMPQGATEYGVSTQSKIFGDFLSATLPPSQVFRFTGAGNKDSVHGVLSESDSKRWREFGWTLVRTCGEEKRAPVRVPVFLVEPQITWLIGCPEHRENIFSSTWIGEPKELTIKIYGAVPVKISTSTGQLIEHAPSDTTPIKLSLSKGERLAITVGAVHGGVVRLVEGQQDSEKLPSLESFRPAE